MTEATATPTFAAANFSPLSLAGQSAEDAFYALLHQALRLRASDLFFLADTRYVTVSARRLGTMERLCALSTEFGRQVMSYVKAFAEVDLSQKRKPLDGRWLLRLADRTLDLRLNFTPTLHGEDLAIRIGDNSVGLLGLDELGLAPWDRERLLRLLHSPHGLLLVTGPTGAGKTTTLYACLRHLNDGSRKINTLEDPVEFALDGVRQSQVNAKLGLDFAELLRNVLRQAPDVVMIGEIRDAETMETAIQAANSGLLVLATLHAPSAATSIQSLLALRANPYFLANTLVGVVSQRLVRTLCPSCRQRCESLETQMPLGEISSLLPAGTPPTIHMAVGCETCQYLGYAGRTGLFEVMPVHNRIRSLIAGSHDVAEIEQEAIRQGMVPLRRSGLWKVGQGVISPTDLLLDTEPVPVHPAG